MHDLDQLAAQLEAAVSERDTAAITPLLRAVRDALASPQGCEDFSDLVFDIVPPMMIASGMSEDCQGAVQEVLASAAERCAARELFTALGSALAHAVSDSTGGGPALMGPASPRFQLALLHHLAQCLCRIQRKWAHFLGDQLDMLRRWAQAVLPHLPAVATPGDGPSLPDAVAGLGRAWALPAASVHANAALSPEEKSKAEALLCRGLLSLAAGALQHPEALQRGAVAVSTALQEAQRSVGGKLTTLQPVMCAVLGGADHLLGLLGPALDIHGVEQLQHAAERHQGLGAEAGDADEAEVDEGLAAALCSSLMASSTDASRAPALQPPRDAALLRSLAAAVALLTDLAARQQSVVLALLPLVAVAQAAALLGGGQAKLGEEAVDAGSEILATLVHVMAHSPVEVVRTSAHEAAQELLDAFDPGARLALLKRMLGMPAAAKCAALQRLRQEIAPAVPAPPFTQDAALVLALPWLRRNGGKQGQGWASEADVSRDADVVAAALNVLRFAILQQLAARRGGARSDADLPPSLSPSALQALLDKDLAPLQACTEHALQLQHAASTQAQQQGSPGAAQQLDAFLAVLRLEEAVQATVHDARELVAGVRA